MERFGYERKRPSNDLSFRVVGEGGPHFDAFVDYSLGKLGAGGGCVSVRHLQQINCNEECATFWSDYLVTCPLRWFAWHAGASLLQPPRRWTSQPHRPSVDKLRATAEEELGALNSGSSCNDRVMAVPNRIVTCPNW